MTKGEKTAAIVVGGVALLGVVGGLIYYATKKPALAPSAKQPVQLPTYEATTPIAEKGLLVDNTEIPDAEKLQQQQQQQVQLPPEIQLPKNMAQI